MSASRHAITPERREAAFHRVADEIRSKMARGLDFEAAFDKGVAAAAWSAVELVATCDPRERNRLRGWAPEERADILVDGYTRLLEPDAEGEAYMRLVNSVYDAAREFPFLAGLREPKVPLRFSEFLRSDADVYTLAQRAINTSRKTSTNRRQAERDRELHLGEGSDYAPDERVGTADEALRQLAVDRSLTDMEKSLLALMQAGYSNRAIEEGTEKSGWKVSRHEVGRLRKAILQKLEAEVPEQERPVRQRLPASDYNPGGTNHTPPTNDGYDSNEGLYADRLVAKYGEEAERDAAIAEERARPLRGPENPALEEVRAALAAIDARAGKAEGDLLDQVKREIAGRSRR